MSTKAMMMLALVEMIFAGCGDIEDGAQAYEGYQADPTDRGVRLDADEPFEDASMERGICIRSPFGPGKVKWEIADPKGAGYSVKLEGPTALVWAAPPAQEIDAIYRRSWGCGVAFKVPDNCTATVTSDGMSCCCNIAAATIGGYCRWVSTVSGEAASFADCPL